MPTQPYYNKAGKRLPGVTTILSRFKDSGALIYWAWTVGRDGKDYRQERDAAANAGTLAHAMVEETTRGSRIGIDNQGNVYAGSEEELLTENLIVI